MSTVECNTDHFSIYCSLATEFNGSKYRLKFGIIRIYTRTHRLLNFSRLRGRSFLSVLSSWKLSIARDSSHNIICSLAPSTKKCSKSTSSPSVPITKCVELPHQYDPNAPIGITPEGYKGYDVNVMGGYDETSTQGILQAVKIDGKRTLSLGGKSLNDDDEDSKN